MGRFFASTQLTYTDPEGGVGLCSARVLLLLR